MPRYGHSPPVKMVTEQDCILLVVEHWLQRPGISRGHLPIGPTASAVQATRGEDWGDTKATGTVTRGSVRDRLLAQAGLCHRVRSHRTSNCGDSSSLCPSVVQPAGVVRTAPSSGKDGRDILKQGYVTEGPDRRKHTRRALQLTRKGGELTCGKTQGVMPEGVFEVKIGEYECLLECKAWGCQWPTTNIKTATQLRAGG